MAYEEIIKEIDHLNSQSFQKEATLEDILSKDIEIDDYIVTSFENGDISEIEREQLLEMKNL